jgi:hypothetical protein
MRPKVIVVSPDSGKELKERVYRLRYRIYVEELGHKFANDERMLHDKCDDHRAWMMSRRSLLNALADTSFPIQKALLRRGNWHAP